MMYVSANQKAVSLNLRRYSLESVDGPLYKSMLKDFHGRALHVEPC